MDGLSAATTDLTYAGLRAWGLTQVRLRRLTRKQPAAPMVALFAVAFSCLRRDYRPAPVVVDQTVRAARQLGGLPAATFVNAVLRRTLSESEAATADEQDPMAAWNAPDWWQARLVTQLGQETAEAVMRTQQDHPPFTLRFLGSLDERSAFEEALLKTDRRLIWLNDRAFILTPAADPTSLPGYAEGRFRVQDFAAQGMWGLLPLKAGDCLLDACAAPGGKTFLALEQADVTVWAMDVWEARLQRLRSEWQRLAPGLGRAPHQLQVRVADLRSNWPADAPEQFDHIILDAPCTGSGVVRRHPDIPWRRSPEQLEQAVAIQSILLERLWKRLKPGGECLYMTCSIFEEEGEAQMRRFLAAHPEAERCDAPGLLLPTAQRDGFFFGRLRRLT